MSNVISSFLVGIGFDYDKKSAKQIESGIDTIKSKALQLGAVVAGGFGIKSLTSDFAANADMLGKFAQVFGVNASEIQAFGNALATEGGSLESFMGQIESLERARARIRVGDVGFFAPAGKAGLDPNVIAKANSATEAYLGLADAFRGMNTQQRINAAEALGLDEASIRLLSQGRDAVEGLVSKYQTIRPLTGDMTGDAAEFNRQWVEAKANVSGFADAISRELLPVINDITKSVNSWFNDERMSKIETIAGLTRATLGGGTPEQNAKSTGLPDWLFTTDLTSTGEALGLPKWMTQPIGDFDIFNKGTAYDEPSMYFNEPTRQVDSIIPTGQFMAPNPYYNEPSSRQSPPSSQQSTTNQRIDVSLNLDGQVIDRKVIKVVNGMTQTAIEDITSNTGG
jgi:hypothetical protein